MSRVINFVLGNQSTHFEVNKTTTIGEVRQHLAKAFNREPYDLVLNFDYVLIGHPDNDACQFESIDLTGNTMEMIDKRGESLWWDQERVMSIEEIFLK